MFNQEKHIDKTKNTIKAGLKNVSLLENVTSMYNTFTLDSDAYISRREKNPRNKFEKYTSLDDHM
jgi:hypothetical protein